MSSWSEWASWRVRALAAYPSSTSVFREFLFSRFSWSSKKIYTSLAIRTASICGVAERSAFLLRTADP